MTTTSNGNRTEWSPIRSVIIQVINKIGRPRSGSPICLITSMITDRIGQHEVLLPINHNFNKICNILGSLFNQNQCSTLIFLLTCPLGNYVARFTCRVYFLVAPKKSPARFARSFIEFSIIVPSNFNA